MHVLPWKLTWLPQQEGGRVSPQPATQPMRTATTQWWLNHYKPELLLSSNRLSFQSAPPNFPFLIKDHSSLLYRPMVWHSLHVPSCNSSAIPEKTHFVYFIFKVDKVNKKNQGSSIFYSQENHLLYDKKRRVHLCHQLKTSNGNIY